MQKLRGLVLGALTGVGLIIGACSDSGTSNPNSRPDSSSVDLSFSDAAVDSALAVVVTVDRITFRGNGPDIVVEQFFNDDTGQNDQDTFTIDLLQFQGTDRRLVLDSVELPTGNYSNMLIDVLDEDPTLSYVTDAQGNQALKVPSDQLKLGGFEIVPESLQSLVIEFGLAQSMTYNPGPNRYILKPRGVRIVAVDQAAQLTGSINHALLQQSELCSADLTGGTLGSVYLYTGHDLERNLLSDNFMIDDGQEIPDHIAPLASSNLSGDTYLLSYLEPGDYTLAVSCHETADDADSIEPEIEVPNPATQLLEIILSPGQTLNCTVPLDMLACADATPPSAIE